MSSWRKLLAQMAADGNPCNYSYDDAARVLEHLDFSPAPNKGSSHRKWRRQRPGEAAVIIGLVDKGHGKLKKEYILDMIATLRVNNLLPEGIE